MLAFTIIHFLLQETGKVRDNSDWERSSFVIGKGRGAAYFGLRELVGALRLLWRSCSEKQFELFFFFFFFLHY